MTTGQLKASLHDLDVPHTEISKKRKVELQALLSSKLDVGQNITRSEKGNDHVQLSQKIKNPSSLNFTSNSTLAVATLSGQIYIVKLQKDVTKISGSIIQKTVLPWKSLQSPICLSTSYLVSSNAAEGGIWKLGLIADGTLTEDKSVAVKNGTDNVRYVQGMAVWSEANCEILFSDSIDGCIKKVNLASGYKEIL